MQTAKLANALASTSAKTAKPSAKSKKKGSPLDEIWKEPDALYALLKLICEKEKAAEEHGSEDERSFEASVAINPYYLYNQDFFGHNEETLDLAED